MSKIDTILFVVLIIQSLMNYFLLTSSKDMAKVNKHLVKALGESMEKVNEFERRGGFKQYQIDTLRKQILIEQGKDLNEMQIISILIAWRDTYEAIGHEKEFIDNYIRERNW